MAEFPLNPPTPGRSKYANDHPLAPNPAAGIQTDGFGGIAGWGDLGTYHTSRPSFDTGARESVGARCIIRQTQPQSRGPVDTPENGPGDKAIRIMAPSVHIPDH